MTNKPETVTRYSSIAHVIDCLARKELPLLDPKSWIDRNDSLFMDFYRQHRKVPAVFAACATRSKETYHHWHVFAGQAAGAAIEFDRQKLEAHLRALQKQRHKLRFGIVRYLTLKRIEGGEAELQDFPFVKRWGFQAEKEYRIISECDDSDAVMLSIPLPIKIVRRIIINPWLPSQVVESLKDRIQSIAECEKLRVSHSHLIASDRWKAAGVRIVNGYRRSRDPRYRALRKSKSS